LANRAVEHLNSRTGENAKLWSTALLSIAQKRVWIADMQIDSYQFGKIVIEGASYNSDCIILGGSVQSNWWREQGHLLSAEDIEIVLTARPSVLMVKVSNGG